jgi:hypothetical protein
LATTTNLAQLEIHLRTVFTELFKTAEFKEEAKLAGEEMKKSVISKMGSSKYDYLQSGELMRVAKDDVPWVEANRTGSKANIGYGDIEGWNDETKRGPQRGKFTTASGKEITVRLRPEPTLPSWIVMEFGRRPQPVDKVPKDFQVPYAQRDASKKFLFGPSTSTHFRKNIFFMSPFNITGNKEEARTHPGIKAGKFFREGLKSSQPKVEEKLGEAIEVSLRALSVRYGGEVRRL